MLLDRTTENAKTLQEDSDILLRQSIVSLGGIQIIQSSEEFLNHEDGELSMWTSDGNRLVWIDIEFRAAFADIPIINLGLTGIGSIHDQDLRLFLRARDVTERGFSIELTTWRSIMIDQATLAWLAIGKAMQNPPEFHNDARA
ncbi:H-type lectin domain-containing protein [Paracoccus sp. (in: a-proteobacteria)]|uniref:H-type lectin domain-containing protein n=1 Tax=Paracoccus sp. TaxID=267 RepID=UPI0028A7AB57|nr:H-type lectin domain-containing protein [Paracoccus sp. (in: a-proteobacteria)]